MIYLKIVTVLFRAKYLQIVKLSWHGLFTRDVPRMIYRS